MSAPHFCDCDGCLNGEPCLCDDELRSATARDWQRFAAAEDEDHDGVEVALQ